MGDEAKNTRNHPTFQEQNVKNKKEFEVIRKMKSETWGQEGWTGMLEKKLLRARPGDVNTQQ